MLAIAVPLARGLTVPGWSAHAAGLLCVILLEAILITLALVFAVIGSRTSYLHRDWYKPAPSSANRKG